MLRRTKSFVSRHVILLFLLAFLLSSFQFLLPAPKASANGTPNTIGSDVMVKARFVDANLIKVYFQGTYYNSSGQPVNLNFLDISGSDAGGAYALFYDHPSYSGTSAVNYRLGGDFFKGFNVGGTTYKCSQPQIVSNYWRQEQAGFATGGGGFNIEPKDQLMDMRLANLSYPLGAIIGASSSVNKCDQMSLNYTRDNKVNFASDKFGITNPPSNGVIETNNGQMEIAINNTVQPGAQVQPDQYGYIYLPNGAGAPAGSIFAAWSDPGFTKIDKNASYFAPWGGTNDNGYYIYASNWYYNDTNAKNFQCQWLMSINPPPSGDTIDNKVVWAIPTATNDTCPSPPTANEISSSSPNVDFVLNQIPPIGAPGSITPTSSSSISSTANAPGIKCSVQFFNPLSWFLCPIAVTMQTLAASLDNQIASLLVVKTCTTVPAAQNGQGDNNTMCNFKGTWNAIRDLSLGLIVIAVLIAVIAQALGFEVVDAYTLKKSLPRVIAVAIGITLAWPLMMLFIGLTNDLGTGIRELIYSTVKAGDPNLYSVALGGGGTFVGGLIGGAGIALLGWAGLLSFAATGALAAAIAFLVLVIRQMVIVLLVIFSPIALVCYVLPNTQKAWKLWWDSFSKALLMFPIIMAFLALGHVFAAISSHGTGTVNQILAFVAYFAPYMLLPYTFRLAGGALATIGGAVHGSSKGMFGSIKAFRGNQMKKNMADMKAGTRFEGSKYLPGSRTLAKGFNRTTVGLGTGTKGMFGFGQRGAEAIDHTRRMASSQLLKDPHFEAIKDDDNALRAATYDDDTAAERGVSDFLQHTRGMTRAAADAEARRAVSSVKASVGFGRAQAIAAAQAMVQTGTAVHDIEDLSSTLARASGGNHGTMAALAGYANSVTKQVGRHDLAPSYGTLLELTQGEHARSRGGAGPGAPAYAAAAEAAWNSGSLYQHANDKPQNIERAIDHFTPMLGSADVNERERAAVFFNELKAMQPNATGDVKNRINDALQAQADNIEAATLSLAPTPVSLSSGVPVRAAPGTPPVQNPATGAWETPATGLRGETARERIERRSRTYERIDPNKL